MESGVNKGLHPGKAERGAQSLPSLEKNSVTLTNMIWLFVVGCFAGFLLESCSSLIVKGYIESRRGMIYGPFNQVYGFGAVVMVLILSPLARRENWRLFVGSAVVGGAFEYLIGWAQEMLTGTVSWDYSNEPFSIGGRTTLVFMVYWGLAGLLLMRVIYPVLLRAVRRIPQGFSRVASRIVACLMIANMLLSLAAVVRWYERGTGAAASSEYEAFLDANYPNDRLREIYPNMRIPGQDPSSLGVKAENITP